MAQSSNSRYRSQVMIHARAPSMSSAILRTARDHQICDYAWSSAATSKEFLRARLDCFWPIPYRLRIAVCPRTSASRKPPSQANRVRGHFNHGFQIRSLYPRLIGNTSPFTTPGPVRSRRPVPVRGNCCGKPSVAMIGKTVKAEWDLVGCIVASLLISAKIISPRLKSTTSPDFPACASW